MEDEMHAASRPAAAPAQPASAGGDAPPSNTASHNSSPPSFFPLRWGIDSLYLSYSGSLYARVETELSKLKSFAQSQDLSQVTLAQYRVGEQVFAVKDRGAGLFPYVLDNAAFRIQLSKHLSKLPLAYVKVSSDYLASHEPEDAGEETHALVSKLGECRDFGNVGRIDLFVDFVTDENLEGWDRTAWVTRAAGINSYSVDGRFSGWGIGFGAVISARLYNKTLEIKSSRKDYLRGLWLNCGWDGVSDVWRLEFQLRREALGQLGLRSLYDVLTNLSGIWTYAATDWLRLCIPNDADKTRSRWPVHPLWQALSEIDWDTPGGPLLREFPATSAPNDQWIFQAGLRPVVAFMAKNLLVDLDVALPQYTERLVTFHEDEADRKGLRFSTYIRQKVQLKVREYGSGYNLDEIPDEDRLRREIEDVHEAEIRRRAEEYRRKSNG